MAPQLGRRRGRRVLGDRRDPRHDAADDRPRHVLAHPGRPRVPRRGGDSQHGYVEHCRRGPALGEPGLAEQRRHGLGIRCRHVGSIGPVGAVRRHRRSGAVAAVERDRGAQPGDRLAGPVGMAPVRPRPGGAGPRRSRAGDRPLPRGGGRQRPVAIPAGSPSLDPRRPAGRRGCVGEPSRRLPTALPDRRRGRRRRGDRPMAHATARRPAARPGARSAGSSARSWLPASRWC